MSRNGMQGSGDGLAGSYGSFDEFDQPGTKRVVTSGEGLGLHTRPLPSSPTRLKKASSTSSPPLFKNRTAHTQGSYSPGRPTMGAEVGGNAPAPANSNRKKQPRTYTGAAGSYGTSPVTHTTRPHNTRGAGASPLRTATTPPSARRDFNHVRAAAAEANHLHRVGGGSSNSGGGNNPLFHPPLPNLDASNGRTIVSSGVCMTCGVDPKGTPDGAPAIPSVLATELVRLERENRTLRTLVEQKDKQLRMKDNDIFSYQSIIAGLEDTLATAAARSRSPDASNAGAGMMGMAASYDEDGGGASDASSPNRAQQQHHKQIRDHLNDEDSPTRTVSFSTLPPQQFSEEVTRHGHSNPTRTSSISSLKAQSSAFVSPLRSSSSNSSFKSQASTPSPGASNRMHGENRGNRSPAGSSHNGSPAGRALSTPELTPPQPDKAAQPKRFYTWQLGKGSSNYQKILERRREMLRSKDLAGSEVLRTEWIDLISELDMLVNAGVERIVKKQLTARRTKSSGDAFDKMRSLGETGRHSAPPSASKSMASIRHGEDGSRTSSDADYTTASSSDDSDSGAVVAAHHAKGARPKSTQFRKKRFRLHRYNNISVEKMRQIKNLKYLDLARRGSSRFLGGVKKLGARSKVTLKAVKSIASFGRKRNNVTGASKDGNSASVQTAPAQPSPLPDINDEMLQLELERWLWPVKLSGPNLGVELYIDYPKRGVRVKSVSISGEFCRCGVSVGDVIIKIQNAVVLGWTCAEVEQVLQAAGGMLSLMLAPGYEVDKAIQLGAEHRLEDDFEAMRSSGSFDDSGHLEPLQMTALEMQDDPYA